MFKLGFHREYRVVQYIKAERTDEERKKSDTGFGFLSDVVNGKQKQHFTFPESQVPPELENHHLFSLTFRGAPTNHNGAALNMDSMQPSDILIVGAGPVGLALAQDLGHRGIRSIVIERNSSAETGLQAKASVIYERTMEFCRLLGVRHDIADAGYPEDLPGDTVFCTAMDGHYIGRLEMPSAATRGAPAKSAQMLRRCPQIWLDPIFARAVHRQGMADIRYGLEVTGCDQSDNDVVCNESVMTHWRMC